MSKRLFVGNLPYTITEERLRDVFTSAGDVESVSIILNRETRQGKGFAFVEMETEEAAKKAIALLNGHQLENRSLIVNEARPQEPKQNWNYAFKGGQSRGSSRGNNKDRRTRY
jgi:RNA recognition motif-containing protein